jgi:hypothetical protein
MSEQVPANTDYGASRRRNKRNEKHFTVQSVLRILSRLYALANGQYDEQQIGEALGEASRP